MTKAAKSDDLQSMFADPEAVARYADGPPRFMPGYADMQIMAAILLAEHAPTDASILVVGAGGGLEIKAFAELYAQWSFVGVDPSAQMIALAAQMLVGCVHRVSLLEGYVDDVPEQLFDGAACLLTLHFLNHIERVKLLSEVRRRLKSGKSLVVAHTSLPAERQDREQWLDRYAQFGLHKGSDPALVQDLRAKVGAHLQIMTPQDDVAIMQEAGFVNVTPFYHGFTWRGWVGYAG